MFETGKAIAGALVRMTKNTPIPSVLLPCAIIIFGAVMLFNVNVVFSIPQFWGQGTSNPYEVFACPGCVMFPVIISVAVVFAPCPVTAVFFALTAWLVAIGRSMLGLGASTSGARISVNAANIITITFSFSLFNTYPPCRFRNIFLIRNK